VIDDIIGIVNNFSYLQKHQYTYCIQGELPLIECRDGIRLNLDILPNEMLRYMLHVARQIRLATAHW
jgi:hypothetical protein